MQVFLTKVILLKPILIPLSSTFLYIKKTTIQMLNVNKLEWKTTKIKVRVELFGEQNTLQFQYQVIGKIFILVIFDPKDIFDHE